MQKLENLINKAKDLPISLNSSKLLECLHDRYRWYFKYPCGQPTIEVILKNGTKTRQLFLKDGFLDVDTAVDYYNKGYTLLLSRIQTLHPDIRRLREVVNCFVGKEVNMNIYFGKGLESVSFPEHTHEYAVLVKNVEGESEWVIGGKKIQLCGQEVLYFDKHILHAVTSISKPKLSITCNLVA